MGIKFGRFEFEGPYDSARFLFDRPGVFIVLCRDAAKTGRFYVVDYDESDHARSSAMAHPRQVDWVKACRGVGSLAVAVMYSGAMTVEERRRVVAELKSQYDGK